MIINTGNTTEITIKTMECMYEAVLSDTDSKLWIPFEEAIENPDLFNAILEANKKIIECDMANCKIQTILEYLYERKTLEQNNRRKFRNDKRRI